MAHDPFTSRTGRWLIPSTLIVIAAVLLAQIVIPFGWALAGLYMAPVALSAFWSSYRHVFLVVWIAVLCTVLSTVIFFGSPFWDNQVTFTAAYAVPIGAMWYLALLSVARKWAERRRKHRATLRVLCASCRQICADGKMWTIEHYAKEREGTFVGVGLCNGCATKRGRSY